MRKAIVGTLGFLVVLVVAFPFCVGIRADSAGPVTPGPEASAAKGVRAAVQRPTWPPKRLRPRAFDVAAPAADPRADRVAFLPMLNRGSRRIHLTYLRAMSATLAAHASIVEKRPISSPELIDAILRKQGQPEWFGQPNHFRYAPRLLERIHRATGAGVVVWAEVFDDGGIKLQAMAMMPGADPGPWQGVELAGSGDLDVLLYDAPRALLARMREQGRIAAPAEVATEPSSPEDTKAFEDARTELDLGDPASVFRAERALASLAARNPSWPDPWVELAFLRVARPLLFEPYAVHAVMNEGPIAARHLAYLMPALSEAQRARLAFVDYPYIGHRRTSEEFAAMVDQLPRGSLERALLALFHRTQDPSRFGVEAIPERGVLGQVLFEVASLPGPSARESYAAKRVETREPIVFATPILLAHARDHYHETGDWSREKFTWHVGSVYAIAQALEALRSVCPGLPEPQLSRCRSSVAGYVNEYTSVHPLDPTAIGDPSKWEASMAELIPGIVSGRIPDHPVQPIPASVRDTQAPEFAGLWYATHLLVRTANETFALRDGVSNEVGDASDLLAGPARDRLIRSVDWMLMAAYQPAVLGMHRGQRDEYEPYADQLRKLSQQYELEMAFAMRHTLDQRLGRKLPHTLALNNLGSRHPYHPIYLDDYARQAGKGVSEGLADWLGALVPMPPVLQARVLEFRLERGERDAVIAALEPSIARRPNARLALTLSSALRSEPAEPKRAIAVLDATLAEFPYDDQIFEQSAWIALEAESLEVAEKRFTKLSEDESDLKEACFGLAQVARHRDELDVAEKILLSCGDRATSRWERHSLLLNAANMQRDAGRYAESLETIKQAAVGIGNSGAVLGGLASTLVLAGELDRAAAMWERSWRLYRAGGGWESARLLAELELSRGRIDRAAEIFDDLYADEGKHGPQLLELGRKISLARDDLAGFQKLCRRTGDRGLLPLARFQWEILQDSEAALATLEEAEQIWPRWAEIPILRGEILLARRDGEAALRESRKAQAIKRTSAALGLEIRSQLALGAFDEVKSRVQNDMARDRWSLATWEYRARLEIAENKGRSARATLAWATRALRHPGADGWLGWWTDIRPLLLLESSLVGRAGNRDDDLRLEALLSQSTMRLPNDPELWQALARVREHLGRADAARSAWNGLARVWPQHPSLPESQVVPAAPAERTLDL